MIRKIVAVWVSLAMLFGFVVIVDVVTDITRPVKAASTLYVGGIGPGNYTSIQWAIDNTSDGDTVFVYSGTYYENVVVNKTINFTGEDRDTTIIDGGGIGDVVNINVNWVNITGFTVTGSRIAPGNTGMKLHSIHNCTVFNNNVSNNYYGISLSESINCNLTKNYFITDGIYISGDTISHFNTHTIH